MVSELAKRVHDLFHVQGYQWRRNGEVIEPVPEDFQEALDAAVTDLYAEPEGSQAVFGGLIVRRRSDNQFEVYLRIGDYYDD